MASLTDLNSTGQGVVRNLGLLVQTMQSLVGNFGIAATGNFTLGTGSATIVLQSATTAASQPHWIPTNAAAATLMGSNKNLFLSARNAGVSFTVATATGSPTGSEQFSYFLLNPTS